MIDGNLAMARIGKRFKGEPKTIAPGKGEQLSFTVPLVPPSVNHFWKKSRHGGFYICAEGKAFIEAVALIAARRFVFAKRYELEVHIYLGYNQRGDGDNFWKVTADSLVKAGVIHSDAAVDNWLLYKHRDPANPRTEITVRGLA